MAKIRYEFAEAIFSKQLEGLLRIRLLEETENKPVSPRKLLMIILHEIDWMRKKDKDIFKKIGIEENTIEALRAHKNALSKDEMKMLPNLAEKVLLYREKNFPVDVKKTIKEAREKEEKSPFVGFKRKKNWLPLSGPRRMPPPPQDVE